MIIEQQSGLSFTEYVETHVFDRAGMRDSGYFALDSLPVNTANGYIDYEDGSWKTNIYAIPVKGGGFVTAPDMIRFWDALLHHELLNETLTNYILTPHVQVKDGTAYGYGMWMEIQGEAVTKYETETNLVVVSNESKGAYTSMKAFEAYVT
nr:serine hydrolase [Thalassobacillus sp. CUG 92003]